MGKRRMLAKEIMLQDKLDELDPIYFKLYTILILSADDDGIVGNPRMVAKMTSCSPALLEVLVKLGYLLQFDDGSVVITHWHIHNLIRKDRYKPSIHATLRKMLKVTEDECYIINGDGIPLEIWFRSGNQTGTKPDPKISKDKLNKDKLNKGNISEDKIITVSESSGSSYTDFEKSVLDLYKTCCPGMPECETISEEMRRNIKALEMNGWNLEEIQKIFTQAGQTDYLTGGGKDGWRADLGWLCKEENLQKIREGRYAPFRKTPYSVPRTPTIYGCSGLGDVELAEIQKLIND